MATRITPQSGSFGSAATLAMSAADAAGNLVKGSRNDVLIVIRNGGGSSITATIPVNDSSRPADPSYPQQAVADLTLVIAAGAIGFFSKIPKSHLDDAGDITVEYSAVTSVTIGAVQVPA